MRNRCRVWMVLGLGIVLMAPLFGCGGRSDTQVCPVDARRLPARLEGLARRYLSAPAPRSARTEPPAQGATAPDASMRAEIESAWRAANERLQAQREATRRAIREGDAPASGWR